MVPDQIVRPARIALAGRLLQASESLLRSHHPPVRALRRLPARLPRVAVPDPRLPRFPGFETRGSGFRVRGRQAVGDEPGAADAGYEWGHEEPHYAAHHGV